MGSLLHIAVAAGLSIEEVFAAIDRELLSRQEMAVIPKPIPANRRRPDNIAVCSVCGKPAVIMPLTGSDWTADATHAVQCQNRPAMDKPWLLQHCGHTEYIVLGDR